MKRIVPEMIEELNRILLSQQKELREIYLEGFSLMK